MIQSLVSGILTGGLYSMIAIGVSLNWGMLGVINLAHFSLTFLAAYVSYEFSMRTGQDPFVSLLFTVPLFFMIGLALQWFFEKFHIEHFTSLLVTFGLFVILESIMRQIWTADVQNPLPDTIVPYRVQSLHFGGVSLRLPLLGVFLAAVVVSIATWLFLERTYEGKALRAISQDPTIAAAFGVNHRMMALLLGGIIGSYAAIAGVFVAMIRLLDPSGATEFIGVVFAVVILGGLGNTLGAFSGGVIIGIAHGFTSATIGTQFAPLVTFSLLIAVLLFKPEGLFTRRST